MSHGSKIIVSCRRDAVDSCVSFDGGNVYDLIRYYCNVFINIFPRLFFKVLLADQFYIKSEWWIGNYSMLLHSDRVLVLDLCSRDDLIISKMVFYDFWKWSHVCMCMSHSLYVLFNILHLIIHIERLILEAQYSTES